MMKTILFSLLVVGGCFGCARADVGSGSGLEENNMVRAERDTTRTILEVVELTLSEDGERIIARGLARTGGWTEPRLVLAEQSGDVSRYRFVAIAPTGLVTQALERIEAEISTDALPEATARIEVAGERGVVALDLLQ